MEGDADDGIPFAVAAGCGLEGLIMLCGLEMDQTGEQVWPKWEGLREKAVAACIAEFAVISRSNEVVEWLWSIDIPVPISGDSQFILPLP